MLTIGNLFIVAAPSGGGKTSLVRQLVCEISTIEISISYTTRGKRQGEKEGADYFFVSTDIFQKMIANQAFIEHACVFNHYYGTSKQYILQRLQAGIDVLLDIDWQGAAQIKAQFPEAVSVFIIPPSLDVLRQRLESRQRDDAEVIETRMQTAQSELSHYPEFDYLVVNEDFRDAVNDLSSIVQAHRLRCGRQQLVNKALLAILLEK